ncbi:MAG: homoserine kinase [Planctomycetes bacterium]|jgi:homoserine kinase|nr:homoserine kinase [Planctomycetota bacterium]
MEAQKNDRRSFSIPLRVRVPGSTSNLGTGFDCLGLALDLGLEVRLCGPARGAHEVLRTGEGANVSFGPDEDLFLFGFERGRELTPFEGFFRFEIHSEIPMGRGLGSSAAALGAGLLLARAIARPGEAVEKTRSELTAEASRIEGHPDNASAALYGGCTLGLPLDDGSVRLLFPEISPELGLIVCWPDSSFSTHTSRELLPAEVPFADAVENPRRLAFLLEGLRTANPEWIRIGIEDRLHVPYRLAVLEEAKHAIQSALAAGAWGATLSGAGSGIVVLCQRSEARKIARALPENQTRHVVSTGIGPRVES